MQMDKPSVDDLFSIAYEELRGLAAAIQHERPNETLNPTALVNEVYLKMAGSMQLVPETRLHFKRIAARAMRQVLVEAARQKAALKRGGAYAFVLFNEELDGPVERAEELIVLDAALNELAKMNPRQSKLVEYRFFGGYDLRETVELLGISESTALRDWRAAKAWLALQIRRSG